MKIEELLDFTLKSGATRAKIIDAEAIPFDREYRKACEQNRCGNYGTNYMCPPDIGDIDELISKAKGFKNGLVFQLVSQLEDSFDFEGMMEGHDKFNALTRRIFNEAKSLKVSEYLLLGAGKCTICEKCAALDKEPCRNPDRAYSALECYGVYVAGMLNKNGMPYNNGEATVSYAGIVLYNE